MTHQTAISNGASTQLHARYTRFLQVEDVKIAVSSSERVAAAIENLDLSIQFSSTMNPLCHGTSTLTGRHQARRKR